MNRVQKELSRTDNRQKKNTMRTVIISYKKNHGGARPRNTSRRYINI